MEKEALSEQAQTQTEAQAEDPKKLAEAMLQAGEPLDNIVAKTGLSKQAILGLKGQLVKSGKLTPKMKAIQAEEEEGVGVPPPQITWLEEVKNTLQRELAKVYGLGKTAISAILDSLDEATASDPQSLFSHIILMSGNPRINYYHVWRIVSSLFNTGPMLPPMYMPYAHGYGNMPYMPLQTHRDNLSSYLIARIERLEDELKEEREKRIQSQFDFLNYKIELLSHPKPSKSTVELLDKAIDKVDARAQRIEELLARGPPSTQFNPQITRTPEERMQKAKEIMAQLQKTEEIIEAENQLLEAVRKLREAENRGKLIRR